jgi:hypothetical protein
MAQNPSEGQKSSFRDEIDTDGVNDFRRFPSPWVHGSSSEPTTTDNTFMSQHSTAETSDVRPRALEVSTILNPTPRHRPYDVNRRRSTAQPPNSPQRGSSGRFGILDLSQPSSPIGISGHNPDISSSSRTGTFGRFGSLNSEILTTSSGYHDVSRSGSIPGILSPTESLPFPNPKSQGVIRRRSTYRADKNLAPPPPAPQPSAAPPPPQQTGSVYPFPPAPSFSYTQGQAQSTPLSSAQSSPGSVQSCAYNNPHPSHIYSPPASYSQSGFQQVTPGTFLAQDQHGSEGGTQTGVHGEGISMMTYQTKEHGPVQIPVNTTVASKLEAERRRRNAGASMRFRRRKKEMDIEMARRIGELEHRIKTLQEERDYFRNIVLQAIQQGGRLPPLSPSALEVPPAYVPMFIPGDISESERRPARPRGRGSSKARRTLTAQGPRTGDFRKHESQFPPTQSPPAPTSSHPAPYHSHHYAPPTHSHAYPTPPHPPQQQQSHHYQQTFLPNTHPRLPPNPHSRGPPHTPHIAPNIAPYVSHLHTLPHDSHSNPQQSQPHSNPRHPSLPPPPPPPPQPPPVSGSPPPPPPPPSPPPPPHQNQQ